MARTIAVILVLPILGGCAGAYVAGDVGAHHDSDNLRGASTAAPASDAGARQVAWPVQAGFMPPDPESRRTTP